METINKLNLAKNIALSVSDLDDENYSLYYLACYGLISKYGDTYLDLIEKLFQECLFFIEKKTLKELLHLSGNKHNVIPGEKACSFSGICAAIDNQLNLVICEDNPIICVSTIDCTPNEKLIITTHEISHIFKSLINNIIRDTDKNTITIRRGLLLETFDADDRDLNATYSNFVLDEIINVFQTADIMKSVCEIDKSLLDDNVRKFFDTLDLDNLIIPSGYGSITEELAPLWENEHFKNSFDYSVVEGDIESIENDFNNIMGEDKFREFSLAIDFNFFNSGISPKKIKSIRTIMSTVFNYNRKTLKKGTEKFKS